jgi:putative ABC transport system substrate-binding protein
MKKLPRFVAGLVLGFLFVSIAQGQIPRKMKIGILLTGNQSHYLAAQEGIVRALGQKGWKGEKALIEVKNAGDQKEKLEAMAKELAKGAYDLLMPVGTAAALALSREVRDIPVVFSSVFDPVSAGIVKSWESSGNNVTGSSTWVNMDFFLKTLSEIGPAARIAAIYDENDKRTVIQVEALKKSAARKGAAVMPMNLARYEDIGRVVGTLRGKVDFIFLSNLVIEGENLEGFLTAAKEAGIPTATPLLERLEKGVLVVVSANSAKIGELAGKKAAQVLEGAKPEELPVEFLDEDDIGINLKTARELGITVPAALLEKASKVIR